MLDPDVTSIHVQWEAADGHFDYYRLKYYDPVGAEFIGSPLLDGGEHE